MLCCVENRRCQSSRVTSPLSNIDGDGYENVTWKVNSRCFKLYCAYSISFNSSKVGNLFWSWILKDCIEVQEKKKKVVVLCSSPPQNVKLGIFTSRSCSDYNWGMYKKRDAREKLLFCQSKGDVTRDDSKRRFLAQHSVATLLRHCFEWLQHCSNIATLCCAKNRSCESSRVTSP